MAILANTHVNRIMLVMVYFDAVEWGAAAQDLRFTRALLGSQYNSRIYRV